MPLAVGTTPFIVQRNIHGYAPGIVAEVIISIPAWCCVLLLSLRPARESHHFHLATIVLALVTVQSCCIVDALVQELTAFLCAFHPIVAPSVVGPLGPYLIESRDMVAGVGETLAETIRGKGDELCLRGYQVHLLRTLLLGTKASEATEARTWLRCIFLWLDTVQDMLSLGLVVDTRIITPTVRGKEE